MTTEVSITVLKTLFALSSNVCAFQDPDTRHGCEITLTDPAWEQVNAHVCHIRGRRPLGPRFDPGLSEAECNAFANLILLCPLHHREIDYLRPSRYTVEVLDEMKSRHEATASGAAAVLVADERHMQFVAEALQAQLAMAATRADVPIIIDGGGPSAETNVAESHPQADAETFVHRFRSTGEAVIVRRK